MFPSRLCLAVLVSFGVLLCWQSESNAQGILRRLRDRIAAPPALPPQALPQAPAASRLPASPYRAPSTNRPASQYRQPSGTRVSPLPGTTLPGQAQTGRSTRVPTPAIGSSGIRQASASETPPANKDPRSPGSSGKSVLVPLGFDADRKPARTDGQKQASIGIRALPANPGYPAVEIVEFLPHANQTGDELRMGDFIFAIEGVATPNASVLASEVSKHEPGDRVRLRIGRDRRVSDLDIVLVELPDPSGPTSSAPRYVAKPNQSGKAPKIGAVVRDVPGTRGVLVTEVSDASPAQTAGLRVDDRIVAVNGKMVMDTRGLLTRLTQAAASESADLRIVRKGTLMDASLDFGSAGSAAPSNVKQATETSTAETSTAETSTAAPSRFGGLGSAIGGFFGSKSAAASPKISSDALELEPMVEQSSDASDQSPLPTPALLEPAKAPAKSDVLALEAPLGQSEELPPPRQQKLPTPAAKPEAEKKDDSESESIRSEIERLQKQLKILESE